VARNPDTVKRARVWLRYVLRGAVIEGETERTVRATISRQLKLLFVVGVTALAGLLLSSCVTPGHWTPELPEKGSAKGGASLLMIR
jgi:hypothetical protein